MDPREAIARKVKAAQALGGFSNAEALAAATKELGNLGLKRIRELQQKRGEEPRVVELRTIAEACGLPYEFFTVDFSRLKGSAVSDRLEEVERTLTVVASTLSLEQLDADEVQVLRRWQRHSDRPSAVEERGSRSREAE